MAQLLLGVLKSTGGKGSNLRANGATQLFYQHQILVAIMGIVEEGNEGEDVGGCGMMGREDADGGILFIYIPQLIAESFEVVHLA